MRLSIRKPSLKKRIGAKTSFKRKLVHRKGLKMPKGYGFLRKPKKSRYRKIYNKTSFNIIDSIKKLFK